MPNYVFLILRNFHPIIFKVSKTSFKQKEYRITLLPSNISERSQFIKSTVCYLIRKDKSWKRNQKLSRRGGVFIDPSKVQQALQQANSSNSKVIRDRFWEKPRCQG